MFPQAYCRRATGGCSLVNAGQTKTMWPMVLDERSKHRQYDAELQAGGN
jgi:hypothetical protein